MNRDFKDQTDEAVYSRNIRSQQKANRFRILNSNDEARSNMTPVEYPANLIDVHRTKFGPQSMKP